MLRRGFQALEIISDKSRIHSDLQHQVSVDIRPLTVQAWHLSHKDSV